MVEEQRTKIERDEVENVDDRANKRVRTDDQDPFSADVMLHEKIAKQIEYYFSDVNLVKDKFMQEQLKKNNNTVKLSVLTTFARLASMTKDENVILKALEDVQSDFMEVDKVEKLIRRKKPLPDRVEYQKQLDLRTVHISSFPDSVKFDDLHRFCSRFGEVESLSMRQHFKTKHFKGCIHVVYKTEADAKRVFESTELKFKDRELRREAMDQYHKRKEDMKKQRMEKRKNRKGGSENNDDKKEDGHKGDDKSDEAEKEVSDKPEGDDKIDEVSKDAGDGE